MGNPDTPAILTAEEFDALPDSGTRQELVRGRVADRPLATHAEARLSLHVTSALYRWADEHRLGEAVIGPVGYILARDPDTVRAPNGCYFAADRVPSGDTDRYLETMPDLVLEVVSKSERASRVMAKPPTGWRLG